MDTVIEPACFINLVASAIETYFNETNGYLVGSIAERKIRGRGRRVAVLRSAYPFQTGERTPTSVGPGNIRAFARMRKTVENVNVGLSLLGGYHSHVGAWAHPELTPSDMDYVEDEVRRRKALRPRGVRKQWLEVVVSIRRRDYARPHPIGWRVRRFNRKLGCTFVVDHKLAYDVTLAAYWLTLNGGDKLEKVEAKIHLPWGRRVGAA